MRDGAWTTSRFLFLLGIIFYATASFGQKITPLDPLGLTKSGTDHAHSEKCAHTLIQARIEKEMGYFGSEDFFEDWIDQKIEIRRQLPQIFRMQEERRLIPVVVHVIHTGNAVGSGSNIPDAQIFEQIRILNEDFRRLNADANRTPAEFLPLAADANIEFVLAKQDPNGLPTNGIVRVQGSKSAYDPNSDAVLIGQTSQWDPVEYMNIWVVPLVQPYIGYASFPVSDLPGLNFSPSPDIIDGVTIDYRYFGTGGSAVSASLGRTATHEVGHFFGLRHIWGDGGCNVDDFVADTPNQDSANNICNSNVSKTSCGVTNMIQNFMDYTPDACMNLFTHGQVDRFNVVLENSPRRVTLVNGRATQDPVLADRDLSLVRIIQPVDALCDLNVTPEVVVQNTGRGTITSARIEFRRNGAVIENRRFTMSLATGQSETLTFNPFLLQASNNQIEFRIVQVNDQNDQNPDNNTKISSPVLQGEVNLPYSYNISSFPGAWVISNPDQSLTWQRTNLTIDGQNQQAIFIRNYEYEAPGQFDYLISPIIDLDKYPSAQLVFEVAHSPYNQAGHQDELLVAVTEGCNATFDLNSTSYQKSGVRLETASPRLDEFVPTSSDQFRTEIFNLSKFSSLGKVRVAIISKNAYGNNVYVRNIRILPTEEFNYELKIEEILSPTPINAGTHAEERLRVSNIGNLPVSKFLFNRTTNSSNPESYLVSDLTLTPGEEINIELPKSTFDGKNRLRYSVSEPNFDQNGDVPTIVSRYLLENTDSITAPWRQNFNNSTSLSPWLTINPENDLSAWTINSSSSSSGSNNTAKLENGSAGNSYWLGSPLFDLSRSRQASVFFDLAAGQVNSATKLKVLASKDGGEQYTEVWSAVGSDISTVAVGSANPNSTGDFVRKYVDLSVIAGSGSTSARIAFVLDLVGSNTPVYLDNIELFLNANPEPVLPEEGSTILFPNPAREHFSIAFNLPSTEDVTIQVIAATGAVVHEVNYPGTLNQTYTFSTELFRSGVYILRITGGSIAETKRLIIN